ncbi:MAG: hypothetical protein M0Q38_02385 [Bacteroidales bacterium]|jgi:hypothetical protein|nr:hypothetical protein [Bacteroidales bacterium]
MKTNFIPFMLILFSVPIPFHGQGIGIQQGARVTVQSGAKIATTGYFGITIESGETGTGSFLDQNSSGSNVHFSGSQRVQRYITGDTRYHFFSPAVSGVTFGTIFPSDQDHIWVREFIEENNSWINRIHNETAIQGKGYSVYLNDISSTTAQFTGLLGTGDIPCGGSLTGNMATGPGNGWNLTGNPYPSAISWNLLTRSGILGSVYAWNAINGNWDSFNGTVGALTDGIIPSGQGFFIQVTGENPVLTYSNSCRVHGNSTIYYKSSPLPNWLTIGVTTSANPYSDKVFIGFDPDATPGFDPDHDAYKLRGEEVAPEIFTSGDPILSIDVLHSVDETSSVSLGFKAGIDADYTFIASGTESFALGNPVLLEDRLTGALINLKEYPVYTFHAAKGEWRNRFSVKFSSVGEMEDKVTSISFYTIRKTICLNFPEALDGTVTVYSMIGQCISSLPITSPGEMKINVAGASGNYIVSVVTNHSVLCRKLFIQ